MALSDDIREFAWVEIVGPQLQAQGFASCSVWDIHTAMGFKNRVPAVRSAIEAQVFRVSHDLRLVAMLGPPTSSTTRFVFAPAQRKAFSQSAQRQTAISWFREHVGEIVPWKELSKHGPRLAIMPKGIYRPARSSHALSVKIIPDGAYADRSPELDNGRLLLRYHQETPGDADPTKYFTNVGLLECLLDDAEVGVIRRRKPKPNPTYEILGVGKVLDWHASFFTIELLASPDELATSAAAQPEPVSEEDARQRTLRSIVARRGQAAFRRRVLAAYGGCCAVSGCTTTAVLEAAHIRPYLGDHTNVIQNGLPLRADIHTLFDLGHLRIHPEARRVVLSAALENSEYWAFNGKPVLEPVDPTHRPLAEHLAHAWDAAPPQLPGD